MVYSVRKSWVLTLKVSYRPLYGGERLYWRVQTSVWSVSLIKKQCLKNSRNSFCSFSCYHMGRESLLNYYSGESKQHFFNPSLKGLWKTPTLSTNPPFLLGIKHCMVSYPILLTLCCKLIQRDSPKFCMDKGKCSIPFLLCYNDETGNITGWFIEFNIFTK